MEGSQAAPNKTGPTVPSVLSILPSAKCPLLHTSICAEQLVHAEADPTGPCKFPAQAAASISLPCHPRHYKVSEFTSQGCMERKGTTSPVGMHRYGILYFLLFCVYI